MNLNSIFVPPEAPGSECRLGHPLGCGQLHELDVKRERLASELVVEVQGDLLLGQLENLGHHAIGQLDLK